MTEPVKYSVVPFAKLFCPAKGKAGSSGGTQHVVKTLVDCLLLVSSISIGVGSLYGLAGLTGIGLIEKKQFTLFLSIAAPLVTMGQYVSPAPVVMDALRRMNPQNLPTPVFQSQAACNILSISYGLQIGNPAVLVTNMFGLAVQIIFLASDHHVRTPNSGWLLFSLQLMAIFHSSLYIGAMVTPLDILGHMITIFNLILFAAPLGKLGTVLRTKNVSSLSASMAGISVANNAVWTLYALMLQDAVLFLPSILGYVLSGFQVLVILWGQGILPFDLAFLLLICREPKDKSSLPTDSLGKGEMDEDEVKLDPAPQRLGRDTTQTPRRISAIAEWDLPIMSKDVTEWEMARIA